jgi:hypothetical protein
MCLYHVPECGSVRVIEHGKLSVLFCENRDVIMVCFEDKKPTPTSATTLCRWVPLSLSLSLPFYVAKSRSPAACERVVIVRSDAIRAHTHGALPVLLLLENSGQFGAESARFSESHSLPATCCPNLH